ncbi:rfaE bifunctional protein kinase chain/domain/rfaE bifunctional protein nucleotidyltransferase chain/domain [Isoptericola sp. CG 20/1183]|uniref:RfaE bifunctional protein kinase chain/domain/rfaE bifunctional protein nucleotidyltransferase chain/domain n=1 Tax=Isoptericola halotolerans TaxID=300560 RepID=A0ABX5E9K5_9MICO|nr:MULTISPECIES: PfkB family carbohydrate kinase [Isoptericola]PRZ02659.1 rfaE bifunctional protein kinase chain/domain/rfaE bifunctional protein nucleotidyltransferase chain/domain [Isoptericola sp. CG 20/1183]PRZ03011.1 rfaE bifunctional protein kinase chain/domain/rfaE bifunctional protein nucleotidyltransferase chain/domain [Isoptericola halotolerans]
MSARDEASHWLRTHLADLHTGLDALLAEADRIDSWGAHLAERTLAGGRLLVAGNGGSAAEAQHLTAELVGRFERERVPLSAIALHAETSSLTALVNDYGPDEMFARQVAAHGRSGDVLVLLSTSGRSANVVAAARAARERGITTWALTGPAPSPLAQECDDTMALPGRSTSTVQELHLSVAHALCAAVDAHLRHDVTAEPGAQDGTHAPHDGRPRVVVVGDVLLDRDVDGQVTRFSPDGPVPVVDTLGVRSSPGGAGLAAVLAADAAKVRVLAPFAPDPGGRELRNLLRPTVEIVEVPQEGGTRRKTRVRSGGQTMVRVDDGGPAVPRDVPVERVREALSDADAVLVSDYGAGTTLPGPLRDAVAAAAADRPVVWDPHPRGGAPVPGVTLVTPNHAEALGAAEDLGLTVVADDPGGLAQSLARAWEAEAVCLTLGDRGAYLARATGESAYVPAEAVAGDPCGAGDRFAATAAVELARGTSVVDVVNRAVHAATAWVAEGGAEGYRRRAALAGPGGAAHGSTPGSTHESDVGTDGGSGARSGSGTTERTPESVAARLRSDGGTVVATGGCFDILHAGHVATLEAAARLGDHLVVLLNGDDSVRRLKGEGRPVVGAADRARVLSALDCVADVVVFDEDDPTTVLDRLRPDVWAKGGDYTRRPLPEAETVRRHGGRVVLLPFVEGRSTTSILDRAPRSARPAAPDRAPATTTREARA